MTKVTTKALLQDFPTIDASTARTIVRLCNGTLDPEDFDAGQKRVREGFNRPSDKDLVLTVINALLGGYGVEGVPYEPDAMRDGDFISYVNFGDTYAASVVWSPDKGFRLESWGDAYERSPAFEAAHAEDDDQDHA